MRGRAPTPASSLEALVHAQPTALSDPEAPTLVQIVASAYVEGIAARAVVTSSSVSSNVTSSGTSTSRRPASSTSSSASASSTMIHTKTPVAVIAGALAGFIVLMAICLSVAIVKHRKRRDTLRLIRAPLEMDSAGSPLDKHPFPPQLHHTLSDRHSHDRPRSHRHSRPHSHNHDRHAHGTGSRSSTAGTAKHQSSYAASSSSGSNSQSQATSSTGSEAGRKSKKKRYPPLVDPNSVAVGGKSQLSQQQLEQLQHQHRLESSPEERDVSVGVPRIVVTGDEGQEGSVRSGRSGSAVGGRRSADDQSFVSGGSGTLVGGVPAQKDKAGSLSIRTAESGLSGSGPPSPSMDDRRPSIESSSLGTAAGSRTSSPQPAVGYPPQQYSPQAYLPQAYSPKTYRPPQQLQPPQQLYPPQTYPPQPYASQPYPGDVPYPSHPSSSQSSNAPVSSSQLLPPAASSSSHLHPSPTPLSIPLPQPSSPNTLTLPSPPAQHTTQSASSVAELQAQIAALRRENEELRLVGIDPSVRAGVDAPPAYDDVGVGGVGVRRGPGR